MLISHKYKFIFIKNTKTAGTSIEVDLSQVMGPDDIVTPIFPPHSGHTPRNYIVGDKKFYNHISAQKILEIISPEIFSSYYKFCVEREPVDKCISYYSMLKNWPEWRSLNQDLVWEGFMERGDFPIDHKKYCHKDGTLAVDRILKYETINEDLKEVAKIVGFEFNGLKAQAKTGLRIKMEVSQSDREKIYQRFKESLKFTGYTLG